MKGLIYPLLAIVALSIVVLATAAVVAGIKSAREQRAIRHAKWEAYDDILGEDGKVRIGVRLAARWGRHLKVLRWDKKTETVDIDDTLAHIEAHTRAVLRAESYNSLTPNGTDE